MTLPTRVAALVALAALTTACSSASSTVADAPPDATTDSSSERPVDPTSTPSDDVEPTPTPTEATLTDAELATLGVNELGRIPVFEWHKIQDANGRWENSLDTFRAQLRELSERGYRPISIDEFIDGTIDLAPGHSPILLTFDDSYKEHFFFGPDGETPDPDSVVGILEAMHEADETWRPLASFAFYWPYPFRETDEDLIARKLRWLVDNGYDLSNHTYNHDNLREMSDDEVVANLARAEQELAEVVGDEYRVRSLTLTQGIWPQNKDLAMAGSTDTFSYLHEIAFEVGFQPTRSPFHVDYEPRSIQRVQAWLPEFRMWLDWLDEVPGRRYVSDGDVTRLSFPAGFEEVLGDLRGQQARPYEGEPAVSGYLPETCVGEDDGAPEPCAVPGEPLADE